MEKLFKPGCYFFAIAIIGFAIIQFKTGNFPAAFLPVPASFPARKFFVYLTGCILLISGAFIFLNKNVRIAAAITGLLFILYFIFLQLPKLVSNLYDPNAWTITFETLAISSSAFILAGMSPCDFPGNHKWDRVINNIAKASCYSFAIALVVFGIQHFMYEDFIMTLIPSWVPAHYFWSYVVRFGFILTAISILINRQTRLSTVLFGVMFLIWILILHGPRVIANSKKETEWTSFFIAMAMAGIGFMLSGPSIKKQVMRN